MMISSGAKIDRSLGDAHRQCSSSEQRICGRLVVGAFSLVEVAIALGVAGFVLIALLGLISQGVVTTKASVEESRALNLLDCIVADRKATPLSANSQIYNLPKFDGSVTPGAAGSFGVGDDYAPLGVDYRNSRFRVDYTIWPTTANVKGPYVLALRASWPAGATTPENSVELLATFFRK